MEKKVSVIIPVYNVEEYLQECLDSMLDQTYKHLEIILIDDGSQDRCPYICDQYATKDDRIKVIHKKNGGAASARNLGLEIASGEYISFVDSDDYVDKYYIQNLTEQLENTKSDIAVCSYVSVSSDKKIPEILEKTGDYIGRDYLLQFLTDWRCGLIWNKLFSKKVIGDIRFEEGHIIDDEFFTYLVVLNARRVYVKNKQLYYYRERENSAMNSHERKKELKRLQDRMEYLPKRFYAVTEKYPELYSEYLANLTDNLIILGKEANRIPELEYQIKKLRKEFTKKIIFGPISIRQKYSYFRSGIVKEDIYKNYGE